MHADSLTAKVCSDSSTINFILHGIVQSNTSLIIAGMLVKELLKDNISTAVKTLHQLTKEISTV